MIIYANINQFMTWFWERTFYISRWVYQTLDDIYLTNNITLLEFIFAIIIASIFITIIMNSAKNTGTRINNAIERKKK